MLYSPKKTAVLVMEKWYGSAQQSEHVK